MRHRAGLGATLLLFALTPMTSCRVAQPPQVETAGLRVDVTRVKQKRGRIDCRLRIWNDHDRAVSFDYGQVRLLIDDQREASPNPPRRDEPAVIQARNNLELRWLFETGDSLPKGNYPVEIRDFRVDDLPSGQTAVFSINL
ncbi:MAG: hypothetical protein KAI24_08060 [Planctomycetes bacterium]|nr:hypothetical protein [Planctomycetota bacterium]